MTRSELIKYYYELLENSRVAKTPELQAKWFERAQEVSKQIEELK
jgi:hypothetical protein